MSNFDFTRQEIREFITEGLGLFSLCFFGGLSVITQPFSMPVGDGSKNFDVPTVLPIAVAHGIILGIVIIIGAAVKGPQFNPAVTAALYWTKRISWRELCINWSGQVAGSMSAGLLLMMFQIKSGESGTDTIPLNLGYPNLNYFYSRKADLLVAFMYEFIATFWLVLVVWSLGVYQKLPVYIVGPAVGIYLTCAILGMGKYTGGALNTTRWIGPAFWSGQIFCEGWWVYVFGPISGGVAAGTLFDMLMEKTPEEKAEESNKLI